MKLDGRESYLVAVTIAEWIEAEKKRGKFERTCDIADLEALLERELPNEKAMAVTRFEGMEALLKAEDEA